MDADLDRQPERRRYVRRQRADRRVPNLRRRSSDREQLVSVTDEDAVKLRLQGYTPPLLIVHTVPPAPAPLPRFDELDDREPTVTVRVLARLADGWARLWRRT